MARKSTRLPQEGAPPPANGGGSPRDRIVAAFMALLADRSIDEIRLDEIAAGAGVSLAELRDAFGSKHAILAAHIKAIDRAVLAGGDDDMTQEPARERLFDVLMRRLEAMGPYKDATRSLMRSAMRHPPLAFALNGHAVRSQQWMLSAAGISASGPKGFVRAQGMAMLFAAVVRTWLHDDDPGLARTMAELDRELSRGHRWAGFLDDLCAIPEALARRRRWRKRNRYREGTDDPGVAA